jgi:hypothetical protein
MHFCDSVWYVFTARLKWGGVPPCWKCLRNRSSKRTPSDWSHRPANFVENVACERSLKVRSHLTAKHNPTYIYAGPLLKMAVCIVTISKLQRPTFKSFLNFKHPLIRRVASRPNVYMIFLSSNDLGYKLMSLRYEVVNLHAFYSWSRIENYLLLY